jgi:hypothetical protein
VSEVILGIPAPARLTAELSDFRTDDKKQKNIPCQVRES